MRPRRRSPRRKPAKLDAAHLAPTLAEIMPIGDGELPVQVLAYRDNRGRYCRIRVDYPNGWRMILRLNARLEVTSSSASIRMVTKPRDVPTDA